MTKGDDVDEMTVADVLRKAIDVLEERGWHQGDYTVDWDKDDGPVCAAGAIGVACGVPSFDAACSLAASFPLEAFAKFLGPDPMVQTREEYRAIDTVAGFNDDPSRSYEDVVLALKHAAVEAETL